MYRKIPLSLLCLSAALVLGACDQQLTAPDEDFVFEDDPIPPTTSNSLEIESGELEATEDRELTAAAVEAVQASLGEAPSASAIALVDEASSQFAAARAALAAGDGQGAHLLAVRARESLGRAIVQDLGGRGVEEMLTRAETLRSRLDSDPGDFANPDRLRASVDRLVDRARKARSEGDQVRAAERLVLSDQLADRDQVVDDTDRDHHAAKARFAVVRAEAAVRLAERLLADDVAETPSQLRLLRRAHELARAAHAALASGKARKAFALGRRAEVTAMLAVVDSDGVSEEEVRRVHDLAIDLLGQARAIPEPTKVQERLIGLAVKQLEAGERKLSNGILRGVGCLWRSAVTSSVAIG